MKELLLALQTLKESEIKDIVNNRISEFSRIKYGSSDEIFKELCFCIMTANCSAAKCIQIQDKIEDGFLDLEQEQLAEKFKDLGYRFPNIRSNYIIKARKNQSELYEKIKNEHEEDELRNWIVKNIKGIGLKEASHFLRNIGFKNYAIVDFHIVDLLKSHNLTEKPKTMTKGKYLEIEKILVEVGNKANLDLAELDLYLWYMETGKILK